jgi:phosphoglucosamine mutase
VFEELGAQVVPIGVSPNGLNINDGFGAVNPGRMRQAVLDQRADAGIALDGDGDRLIMVDARGEILDGDDILFVIAEDRKRRGVLGGGVVGTLMTNLGLEESLGERGIVFDRSNVGDRQVLERLRSKGWLLGGETSGHIVCLDQNTTGDGIIAALQVLFAIVDRGKALSDLRRGFLKYPQRIENVRINSHNDAIFESPGIQRAVRDAEADLGSGGRVLLRLSGTEALVRVMVEGAAEEQVNELAGRIALAVEHAASVADAVATPPAATELHGA